MESKRKSLMIMLIGAQVVFNFIVGIFASRMEELVGLSPFTLITLTLLGLFSLTYVTFRLWEEENQGLFPMPLSNNSKNASQEIGFNSNTKFGSEYLLITIPIGITLGALLAIILVPLFSSPIGVPIEFNTDGVKVDGTIKFAHWYELIGIIILLAISMYTALKWHGIGSVLLLASSISSFTAVFTVLDTENHFMLSLVGWAIPAFIVFVMLRGIIALFKNKTG